MNKLKTLIISVICVGLSACASSSSKFEKQIGQPAPYTRFTMLDGQALPIEAFRGKRLVIVFWAATCTASQRTMDRLNEYAATNAKAKNFEVVAVSLDKAKDVEKLKERIKWGNLTAMRHAFSGNEIYDEAKIALDVGSMPYIFVISPQGTILAADDDDDIVYSTLG